MAIATVAALKTALQIPGARYAYSKGNAGATVAATWVDMYLVGGTPIVATAPSTAVALDRTFAGALGQYNGASGTLRIIGAKFGGNGNSSGGPGAMAGLIYDRLVHQGGLSGTVTTAQTTNLPTPALTRYTSGVGVQIGIMIYTSVGTNATTLSISYTNQAGTSGRISDDIAFGSGANTASRILPVGLAAGDTGVKSVESVTVVATTGTAGNFGVILYKPLVPLIYNRNDLQIDHSMFFTTGGFMPEILDDACLFMMVQTPVLTAGPVSAVLYFNED